MAGKIITDFIKMQLFKKGGAIASDKAVKFSADALETRLKNLGIEHFLPKPYSGRDVLKAVDHCLSQI